MTTIGAPRISLGRTHSGLATILVALAPSIACAQDVTSLPDLSQSQHWSEDLMPSLDVTEHVQLSLKGLGYTIEVVDGIMGEETREAITAFRRDHGLPEGDEVDGRFLAALERIVAEEIAR